MILRVMTLIGIFLSMSACSVSPKPDVYLLTAIESEATIQTTQKPVRIYIKEIVFPEFLDRPQMVTRKDTQLEVHEFQRWGEPLKSTFMRVFREDLLMRTNKAQVIVRKPYSAMEFDCQLYLDVSYFYIYAGQEARLTVSWFLLNAQGNETLFSAVEKIIVPLQRRSVDAEVKALSNAIGKLADKVAAELVKQ